MRNTMKTAAVLLAATAFASYSLPASACTSLLLKTADGGHVYGRTLEFGMNLDSQAIVIPRGIALSGTGPAGEANTGLKWTGKYGVAGINGIGLPIVIDGINEKGLAGGMLYLPYDAKFQEVKPDEAAHSLASWELLTYLLTSYATVDEVKAALPKIKVSRAPQAVFKGPVPVHYTLHDATGASIVVEYVGGELHIYDNPTTILTNGPTFPWHLANLGQYGNLSPNEPQPMQAGNLTLNPPSTGAGMHGLPGDVLSPSRFVRAFFYARSAPQAATATEGVHTVRHIMNVFDIPPGVVATSADSKAGGGVSGYETTEVTSIADLKNMRYYFTTYSDLSLRMLDLRKIKLDGKAPTIISADQKETVKSLGE